MKYIRTLILAAILVASAAPADPPVFSQLNNCCWIASWVQLVYNLRPLIDQFLSTDRAAYSNMEDFKKTAIGKQLAQEKMLDQVENPITKKYETVEVSVLKYRKEYFTPELIAIMDAYREIFSTIRTRPTDQNSIDNKLTALQKLLQKEKFGKFNTPEDLGINSFFAHLLFTYLVEYLAGYGPKNNSIIADGIASYKSNPIPLKAIKPFLIVRNLAPEVSLDLKNSFSLDLTPFVTEQLKNSGQCLKYDLIGIGTVITKCHWWVFIKDQYDPAEQWWRCDTLNGNRRVIEQEIITECTQYTPYYLTYKAQDCTGQAGDQDSQDVETLARILWELSK